MSILIDKDTQVLIQGITGAEGSRMCRDLLAYGTQVVAGVTPGKGGASVEGVPVYNSVAEARAAHAGITCTSIVVPARFAKAAALEALDAGVPLVHLLTEQVPTQDTAYLIARAGALGARLLGPSSIGIISPTKSKVGPIGVGDMSRAYAHGPVGLVSKSGGMTSEIALTLSRAGLGVSTALGIGADGICGTTFADTLELFAHDRETAAVVLFGEVGGSAEEDAAVWLRKNTFNKPVVALVAGEFGSALPQGTVLGHAGAIVSRGSGSYASKVEALQSAGVTMVTSVEGIPAALTALL